MSFLSSEDDLIARYFAPLAGPGGLGLRDDAALLSLPPGSDLVVTKDALVAGVHFFAEDPLDAVARKALRVNLSDLAAKGAEPLGYLLAIALPSDFTDAQLALFARGLADDGAAYGMALLGGDTVRTPGPLTISVTALGRVPTGRMVPRTGVRAGDQIYVTGTIGDAALGLQMRLDPNRAAWAALSEAERAHLLDRYLLPRPRNGLAAVLRAAASGGMDVSDGLVGDLTKMLAASAVGARVDLGAIPLSAAARAAVAADAGLLETALTGGDDYEVLASVPAARAAAFEAGARDLGIPVTAIGTAEEGLARLELRRADGTLVRFERNSFSHF